MRLMSELLYTETSKYSFLQGTSHVSGNRKGVSKNASHITFKDPRCSVKCVSLRNAENPPPLTLPPP